MSCFPGSFQRSAHQRFSLQRLSRRRAKESPGMEVLYRCCCGLNVRAQTVVACLITDGQKRTRTVQVLAGC